LGDSDSSKSPSIASLGGGIYRVQGTSQPTTQLDGLSEDGSLSSSNQELRDALNELEEKYKKAMVQNAQLDNERAQLSYQCENLRDIMEEQEDEFYRLKKEHRQTCSELEKKKLSFRALYKKCSDLKYALDQRDELIQSHGLLVVGETPEEEQDDSAERSPLALLTPEAAKVLESVGQGTLDDRLKRIAQEKKDLTEQIHKLKMEVEEGRRVNVNGGGNHQYSEDTVNEMHLLEVQREANKQVSEYKLKLQKSEQDLAAFHANVSRLESQLQRYKQSSENYEKNEDEMRAEKRKLQRDLRSALDRIEEMEMTNSHLEKRLERMRATRSFISSSQS